MGYDVVVFRLRDDRIRVHHVVGRIVNAGKLLQGHYKSVHGCNSSSGEGCMQQHPSLISGALRLSRTTLAMPVSELPDNAGGRGGSTRRRDRRYTRAAASEIRWADYIDMDCHAVINRYHLPPPDAEVV